MPPRGSPLPKSEKREDDEQVRFKMEETEQCDMMQVDEQERHKKEESEEENNEVEEDSDDSEQAEEEDDPIEEEAVESYWNRLHSAESKRKRARCALLNQRWADISGSANLDAQYKHATQVTDDASQFVCMCMSSLSTQSSSGGEGGHPTGAQATEDSKQVLQGGCDGGISCICFKPVAQHPGHTWTISKAGLLKLRNLEQQISLRDPKLFGLRTFESHKAWGVFEVVQNLILDFEEAIDDANLLRQWAICEALAYFLPAHTECLPRPSS